MKSQRLWILILVLAVQLGLLGYIFFNATMDGRYFLAHEDEVINYCSAKLFAATGSLRAEGCIAEDVSRIGQMNWYGPGYHLIYGPLIGLFGDHPALFIQIHFACALIGVLLILLLPVDIEKRLLIAVSLVFTQQFVSYVFTYFPESIHLLQAVILIYHLIMIHDSKSPQQKNMFVAAFVALVMVFTISRVTTIFWLAALIGLSNNRVVAIRMTMVFAAGILLTLIYMKFYTAPPYAGEMQKIDQLYEFDLAGFALKTIKAVLRNSFYLLTSGSMSVYYLLALMAITAVEWWRTKDRYLLAALLVSVFLMTALMAYYSPTPWYFLKQSAVLVPLLLAAGIMSNTKLSFKYGILGLSFVGFLLTFNDVLVNIDERRKAFATLEDYQPFEAALQQLSPVITEDHDVTILYCYNEFDFGTVTEALLPFSTTRRYPILYTTNIVTPDEKPEAKFKFHHKLKVDYLLSRQPLEWSFLKEAYSTPFYHFYKVIEPIEK